MMKRSCRPLTLFLCAAILAYSCAPACANEYDFTDPNDPGMNLEGKNKFDKKYAEQFLKYQHDVRLKVGDPTKDIRDIAREDLNLLNTALRLRYQDDDPIINDPQLVLLHNSLKIYYGDRAFISAYVKLLAFAFKNDMINRFITWNALLKWFEIRSDAYNNQLGAAFDEAFKKALSVIKGKFGLILTGSVGYNGISSQSVISESGLQSFFTSRSIAPVFVNQLRDLELHIKVVRLTRKDFEEQYSQLLDLAQQAYELHKQVRSHIVREAGKGNANQSTMLSNIIDPDGKVILKLMEVASSCKAISEALSKDQKYAGLIEHKVKGEVLSPYLKSDATYLDAFVQARLRLRDEIDHWNSEIVRHNRRKLNQGK